MEDHGPTALFHGSRQPFKLIERSLPDAPAGGIGNPSREGDGVLFCYVNGCRDGARNRFWEGQWH